MKKILITLAILFPIGLFAATVPWNRPTVGTLIPLYIGDNVGIGTTSPGTPLSVTGSGVFTGPLTAPYFNATSTTATSTFRGGFTVGTDSNSTSITNTGSVLIGASTWGNTAYKLNVMGSTYMSTTLYQNGSVYLGQGAGINAYLLGLGQTGKVGVSTTTPYAKLSIQDVSGSQIPLFAIGSSSPASTTVLFEIKDATTTANTGLTIDGGAFNYDISSGVTSVDNLTQGSMSFDTDAGAVTWADLPITSASINGTVESFTASIADQPILTVYGESNGNGWVNNPFVGIGTSTPIAPLTITASSTKANAGIYVWGFPNNTGTLFRIATSTLTNYWDAFIIDSNGKVGIGTTSPSQQLSVAGNGYFSGQISAPVVRSFESVLATSTSMTVDWNTAGQQLIKIGVANISVAFSNYNNGQELKVLVCNPNTGLIGSTTFSGVVWDGGINPGSNTNNSQCDVFKFLVTAATSTQKILGSLISTF